MTRPSAPQMELNGTFCRMTKHVEPSREPSHEGRGVIYDATRIRLNYRVQSSHDARLLHATLVRASGLLIVQWFSLLFAFRRLGQRKHRQKRFCVVSLSLPEAFPPLIEKKSFAPRTELHHIAEQFNNECWRMSEWILINNKPTQPSRLASAIDNGFNSLSKFCYRT